MEIQESVKTEILTLQKQLLDMVETVSKEGRNLDQCFKSSVDKFNARLDALEIAHLQRNGIAGNAHVDSVLAKDHNPERKSAFLEGYMRKGLENMPTNQKALIEADATTGGFFIIPEFIQEILKSIVLISPIRQFAKIRTTTSTSVKQPKRTSTPAASWGAEAVQQAEMTGLRYGIDEIPVHLMTAFQDISNEDLEDPVFDLSGEVNSEISEQFAKAEGASFVNGTGKNQPEGFMTNSAIAVDVTGNATGFGVGDAFTTCAHNLKSGYVAGARWFMNRQTIGQVRLLKDNQNRPLWLPFTEASLAANNGATIVGLPYTEVPDMPNVGAGNYPVALGNWGKAYIVVDRIQISMFRDPYSQSSKGLVRFLARKRVGGQVILTEAIRKIQVHT